MKEIHDRMPVILGREEEDEWLDPEVHEQSKLERLLKPCPSQWLCGVEISTLVHSSKKNSPELLKPVEKSTDQNVKTLPLLSGLR